jgi:hypothetical protein
MSIGQSSVVAQTGPFAGVYVASMPHRIFSYVNAESTAEIAFGTPVFKGTADNEALIGAADATDMLGIVVHSHLYAKAHGDFAGDLGTTGLLPGVVMSVLQSGIVYVTLSENSITPASAVRFWQFVHSSNGAGTFGKTADTEYTQLIPAANARYLDSGGAGDVVRLELSGVNIVCVPDT